MFISQQYYDVVALESFLFSIIDESCIHCCPICIFLYFYLYIFQFNDDKDDGEISKIEEMKCPEAYPWQTIKTENEGKTGEVCYQSAFLTQFSCQNYLLKICEKGLRSFRLYDEICFALKFYKFFMQVTF